MDQSENYNKFITTFKIFTDCRDDNAFYFSIWQIVLIIFVPLIFIIGAIVVLRDPRMRRYFFPHRDQPIDLFTTEKPDNPQVF